MRTSTATLLGITKHEKRKHIYLFHDVTQRKLSCVFIIVSVQALLKFCTNLRWKPSHGLVLPSRACVFSNLTSALSIQALVLGNSFSMCLHNMQFFTAGSCVACGLCFIQAAGKCLFLCRTHQFVLDVFWSIQRDGIARWHGAFGRIPILFEMGFMIRCVNVCVYGCQVHDRKIVTAGVFFFVSVPWTVITTFAINSLTKVLGVPFEGREPR